MTDATSFMGPRSKTPTFLQEDCAPPTTLIFDVDQHTGFMAPRPPISRLPGTWEAWEAVLDGAIKQKLQLADKIGLTPQEANVSRVWRERVRDIAILSVNDLFVSAVLLRRAHLVLAYVMHFYVHTLPLEEQIIIPNSIGIPLLKVSKELDIPPILTFSDTVLYNWDLKPEYLSPNPKSPPSSHLGYADFNKIQIGEEPLPTPANIRSQTLFTSCSSEEQFYLCSARIELRGVEILELMKQIMDEIFVGDIIAVQRIIQHLQKILSILNELKEFLTDLYQQKTNSERRCDPEVYYNEVRPWLRGEDSSTKEGRRKWIFESIEEHPDLESVPKELSGPSAGQSSLVHVLDIFLGVDHQSTAEVRKEGKPTFMDRMRVYMPKNHRAFLDHLKANPRPLRSFVLSTTTDGRNEELLNAYNQAVKALKEFRDAHMIVVTLYILRPARKAASLSRTGADVNISGSGDGAHTRTREVAVGNSVIKGTGGTDLVKFLKDTRTRTAEAMIVVDRP